MWSYAIAFAIVCVFGALMYVRSGAIAAVLQTTILGLSLFTILKVAGRGLWTTAFRSLTAHPGRLVFILILLGLFITRRWETLDWPVALDLLLAACFLWAFDILAVAFFQKHVFAKSRGESKNLK
jgi:uncharacterized membrane protein